MNTVLYTPTKFYFIDSSSSHLRFILGIFYCLGINRARLIHVN